MNAWWALSYGRQLHAHTLNLVSKSYKNNVITCQTFLSPPAIIIYGLCIKIPLTTKESDNHNYNGMILYNIRPIWYYFDILL